MSTSITVGECSICGGRVSILRAWYSTKPAIPTCDSCGAQPKNKYGAKIEMERPGNREFRKILFGEKST